MSLINLYDNFLIYYPNIFFPAIIVVGILILVFIIVSIFLLGEKIKIIYKEINYYLKQARKIKPQKKQTAKHSLSNEIIRLIKLFIKISFLVLTWVNIFFTYAERQAGIILKRIKKEIFV